MTTTRRTVSHPSDGSIEKLSFTAGPFAGIIFSYGRVQFIEEADQLRIKFNYDVHSLPAGVDSYDETIFKNEIGAHLLELLHLGLYTNSLVYTGGSDEPQTKDTE